ncbi:MAG: threonine aldolase family protein [Gemmatimonadaceae bacterium]|nr:threonine aldolase family protein [Gemmatimonadaceae bacterium]
MSAPAERLIDLRSDTVTRPTAAMRRAMADADVGDDVLEGDPTTGLLEAVVAEMLGKERALFFPTGTMANQAAIWLLSRPGTDILVDGDAHIVTSEMSAAAAFSGVQVRVVRAAGKVMNAADVTVALPTAGDAPEQVLLCIENTHNSAGGAVTTLDAVRAMREVADRAGLAVHLDGARLWNASAATGTSLADFAACADTVMVSFSKGLGAPVGAALAGPADVIARAVRVRRRLGGGMRQSGIIAAGALHGVRHHLSRLVDDHASARYLAQAIDGVGGVRVVQPDTNIVMIDLPTPNATAVVARARAHGVLISHWHASRVRAVTHLDAPAEVVADAAQRLIRALSGNS